MAADKQAPPVFETVLYERKGPICYITLNRPHKLNAASDQLVEDVNDALFEFDADPDLQVAILAGAGRAFCSGADVQQRQLRTPEEMRRLGGPAGRRSRDNGLGETVNWKPAIAAVHGYALGLGYSLSQSCDLVVAAEGTKFQIREVQRGLGGAQHWVATWFWTGSRFANEVALTGRMFTAEEAFQHGMVNRVVPRAELLPAAEALAAQIIENPPLAVRANVRVMRWFVNEMQRQSRMYTQGRGLHLTEDFRESATAFVEKRKAAFKGTVTPMTHEFATYDKQGRIAVVTVNRPERMNALHPPASFELDAIWNDFEADPEVWVGILTGAGDKAFSAGNDLRFTAEHGRDMIRMAESGFGGLTGRTRCWKPIIAAVNGYALGGGFEMALACDIIIAAEHARLGLPEPRVGLMAGAGGVHRLPRMIPQKIAMGYLLTGRHMTAAEGHRLGVVNEVVPLAQLMPTAMKWANEILECAPLSIRATKQATLTGLGHPLDIALKLQYGEAERMRRSEDTVEGPRAFAEKRKPRWKAR